MEGQWCDWTPDEPSYQPIKCRCSPQGSHTERRKLVKKFLLVLCTELFEFTINIFIKFMLTFIAKHSLCFFVFFTSILLN